MKSDFLVPALGLGVAVPILLSFVPVSATLTGRVVSRVNDQPVAGATVTLVVREEAALTNEVGEFSFGELNMTAPDTLLIRHSEIRPVRIPLGSPETTPWDLTITVLPGPIEANGGVVPLSPDSVP